MTQHLSTKTMPDFFGKRFDSKALKIAASFIVFIFLIPYTASLYNGLSSLFHIAFDIPYWVVIAVMAGLTGLYVIFGGYMATAINDFIQGIIMLGGIVAIIAAVLADNGGLSQSIVSLSQVQAPEAGALEGAYSSFVGPQPMYLLIVVLLTSLGTWGLPQMVGKFYSIKNEDAIKKGTIISTVFAIIVSGGCYFLGGFGRLYDSPALYNDAGKLMTDSIIPTMLSKMPGVIIAVVMVLVLSASMSTLSSLVLTSSSTLTLDVILPMRKKETKEKTQLIILRLFILFFIIVSAVLAVLKDTINFSMIAQMMGVSWGALAGSFLAPFLYGLYWKRTTKASVAVSFVFSSCLMITQMLISMGVFSVSGGILGFVFKNSLYSGVVAMVGGLILVPIISLLTPKMKKDHVDAMFTCYNENVTVQATKSLGN